MALEVARSTRVWDPIENKPCVVGTGLVFFVRHLAMTALLQGHELNMVGDVSIKGEVTVMASVQEIAQQTEKRRTFAIISHPDAGKNYLNRKITLVLRYAAHSGDG